MHSFTLNFCEYWSLIQLLCFTLLWGGSLKVHLCFIFDLFWILLSCQSQGSKGQQQSGYVSSRIESEHHNPRAYEQETTKALHAMSDYIPQLRPDFCLFQYPGRAVKQSAVRWSLADPHLARPAAGQTCLWDVFLRSQVVPLKLTTVWSLLCGGAYKAVIGSRWGGPRMPPWWCQPSLRGKAWRVVGSGKRRWGRTRVHGVS